MAIIVVVLVLSFVFQVPQESTPNDISSMPRKTANMPREISEQPIPQSYEGVDPRFQQLTATLQEKIIEYRGTLLWIR